MKAKRHPDHQPERATFAVVLLDSSGEFHSAAEVVPPAMNSQYPLWGSNVQQWNLAKLYGSFYYLIDGCAFYFHFTRLTGEEICITDGRSHKTMYRISDEALLDRANKLKRKLTIDDLHQIGQSLVAERIATFGAQRVREVLESATPRPQPTLAVMEELRRRAAA